MRNTVQANARLLMWYDNLENLIKLKSVLSNKEGPGQIVSLQADRFDSRKRCCGLPPEVTIGIKCEARNYFESYEDLRTKWCIKCPLCPSIHQPQLLISELKDVPIVKVRLKKF